MQVSLCFLGDEVGAIKLLIIFRLNHIFDNHKCHPKLTPAKSESVPLSLFSQHQGFRRLSRTRSHPRAQARSSRPERQEGRIGHRQGRRQVERNPSDGATQMPEQSGGDHHKPQFLSPAHQGTRQLRER